MYLYLLLNWLVIKKDKYWENKKGNNINGYSVLNMSIDKSWNRVGDMVTVTVTLVD
jgi:hypothetical protein